MFRSLAALPIDTRFLTTPSEEEEGTRRSQMNLSRHCAYCEARLLDLAGECSESMSLAISEREQLHWFTASLLSNLLSLSSIVTPGGNEAAHHASLKRQMGGQKLLPLPARCDAIAEGMNLSWGALYGSLGYFLSLRVEPLSYATPSLMMREAASILISITSGRMGVSLDRLSSLMRDPSPEADWLLYAYHVDFLRSLEGCSSLLAIIRYIPPILDWYLSAYRSGVLREPLPPSMGDSNEKRGYDLMLAISHLVLDSGLEISPSLLYEYVHQSLPWGWYELHEGLMNLITTTLYSPGADVYAGYLSSLLQSIPPTEKADALFLGATSLLQAFPPGGFNLLLILLAGELLNRAHILSETKESYTTPERVRGLLHLASLLLRKSSLSHVRLLGTNLGIAARSPYTEPQITDLFKL